MAANPSQDNWFEQALYGLLAPPLPANPEQAGIKARDAWRRGRLVAFALFCQITIILFVVPIAISGTQPALQPLIPVYIVLLVISTILNRRGRALTAGYILVAAIEMILMVDIATTPGGIDVFTLPMLDIMIQADLFAVAVLVPSTALAVVGINILYIAFCFFLVPHTPAFTAMLAAGKGYDAFFRPVTLHFMATVICIVAVNGMRKANRQADMEGEKVRLYEELGRLTEEQLAQKEQLASEIQMMQETISLFSNGDYNARIPQRAGMLLWPLGAQLNNLLIRSTRFYQQAEPAMQTSNSIRALIGSIRQARATGKAFPITSLPRTGTPVDTLVQELWQAFAASNTGSSSVPPASSIPRAPVPSRGGIPHRQRLEGQRE
jgi:hypothetical protein